MSDFLLLHSALHGLGAYINQGHIITKIIKNTSDMHDHAFNQLTVCKDGDLVFDGILEYQLVLAKHLSH